MKKSNLRGWQMVYKFSFLQTIKSKTFIVSTILTSIVMLAIAPFMISNQGEDMYGGKSEIKEAVFVNDTELSDFDYSLLNTEYEDKYSDVKITESDKKIGDVKKSFEDSSEYDKSVIVYIGKDNTGFTTEVIKSKESELKESDVLIFSDGVVNCVQDRVYKNAGITEDKIKLLNTEVNTEVNVRSIGESSINDTNDNGLTGGSSQSEFGYIVAFVLYILLIMCGENIATSIVTEKASRVVEYLMTSIKPLALVVGKAFAAVTTSIIQVGVIIASSVISVAVCISTGIVDSSQDVYKTLKIDSLMNTITPFGVISALVILFLGFCLFTMLACLVASTASRIEEIGETNMVYLVLVMLGLFLTFGLWNGEGTVSQTYENVMLLLPITAPFAAPTYALAGDLSIIMTLAVIGILLGCFLLLGKFVSVVYEMLIMYTGNRVKFKQLLKIYSNAKKGGSVNE